jgi:RNA polymerase subunit RPABC4/transcription elongation factor Spt4
MHDRQIDPGHGSIQRILRIVGPILVGMGVLLIAIGIGSFFMAFGGSGPPKYFWCAFAGMPLLFVGGVMTSLGFMGKVARYQAQEMAPVAKDAFNYMAEGTQEGIETVAGALGRGLRAGGLAGDSKTMIRCHKCNALVDADAKFCDQCGQSLEKNKPCPQCRELNDPDARFCDNCGYKYV